MYRLAQLISVILITAAGTVFAEKQPQSVMFSNNQDQSQLTSPAGVDTAKSERCERLAKELEALKGKPQRRYTAAQRYEAECQR